MSIKKPISCGHVHEVLTPPPTPQKKFIEWFWRKKSKITWNSSEFIFLRFRAVFVFLSLIVVDAGPGVAPPPLRTCPQLIYVILLTPSLTSELKEAGIIWQNIWFYFFINIPKTLNCKKVSFVVFQYGGTQYEWSSSLKRFPPKFSSKKYKKGNNH